MRALVSFLPMLGRLRGAFATAMLLSLVTIACGIGLLGLSGWFLTAAALSTLGSAFNIFMPSAGVRGLSFLRILARYGERVSGHDATLKLLSDIRQWLFARLFPIVPSRHLARADLVDRLIADVEALDTVFLVAMGPILAALLVALGMSAWLAWQLPLAAPVYLLAMLGAALLIPAGLVRAAERSGEAASVAGAALRRVVLDGLDGHQDLVLFGAVPEAEAAIAGAGARLSSARQSLGWRSAIGAGLVQVMAGIALLGTLVAGLAALEASTIDGPMLAALLLAVIASFEVSASLVRSAARLAVSAGAARRLRALADGAPAVAEPATPAPAPTRTDLRFEAVSFGYDPARPVLDGIDLAVAAGDHLAIVGPSGAGKSTIAQLIARLADPQRGRVLLGGVDLKTLAAANRQKAIAVMTQDAPVFFDTVRNNLRIGRPDADDAALRRALREVRLEGLDLDAIVGEAGQTLSAGQARRLCLARTLLSPAGLIVLDEPTSGLDAETEAAFFADLPALAAGRTLVLITHAGRLEAFDRVLTLRQGKLA